MLEGAPTYVQRTADGLYEKEQVSLSNFTISLIGDYSLRLMVVSYLL